MADAGSFQTGEEIYLSDRDAERKMYAQLMSKLQKARVEFAEEGVTANGRNNFNNFDYIQLKDILKIAIPLLDKHRLATHHRLHECPPLIDVVDTETGYSVSFGTNYREGVDGKNTNQKLQSLGSSESYIRRYIYLQILDIYEADPDQNFGKHDEKKAAAPSKTSSTRLSPSNPSRYKKQETAYDLAKRIGEEIGRRGLELNDDSKLSVAREWWEAKKITPHQYREIKQLVEGKQ